MLSLSSAVSGFASVPISSSEFCYCGNYPLAMDARVFNPSGVIAGLSHQMCFDGKPAYMGTAGTHSPSGSDPCPPEYRDQSAEDGADCSAMIMTAGACGAAAVDTDGDGPPNEPVTKTIPWTELFGNVPAQATTANVGDTLQFVWEGNHNIHQMPDKAAFENCDFTGANRVDGGVSPFEYTLDTLPAYFACSVPVDGSFVSADGISMSGNHCVSGQKLAVTLAPCGDLDPRPHCVAAVPCDSLAACNGEDPATVGMSAACYQAVGGIIQEGKAPASWGACNNAEQATVSTACQEAVFRFGAGC